LTECSPLKDGSRTELFVTHAAPVVFPAPGLIAGREDLALLPESIGHDFVRFEVMWCLKLFGGICADPLPADAEAEESDQHLPLDLPGDFAYAAGAAKILQAVSGDIDKRADPVFSQNETRKQGGG
jgi:hypothetical protein